MNGRTRDEPVWTLAQVDAFAEDAHRGQTRNTGDETAPDVPYIVHPRAVVAILRDEHPDKSLHADWIAATALLHDVLEDCDVHPDTLTTLFGAEICAAVRALSKQMRAVEGAGLHARWLVGRGAALGIRGVWKGQMCMGLDPTRHPAYAGLLAL